MTRVLVTGHTGFKGAWLSLLLAELGHSVSGFSLGPEEGSLFELAEVASLLENDFRGDVRCKEQITKAIDATEAEIIFHLAAQPLVRAGYRDPRFTFETNVMGTYNLLEAANENGKCKALIVVTTDKVYMEADNALGYLESDPLGGQDPYSASKAMADILTQSWAASFPTVPTAIVRGGNVIGGGDISTDRLLVDLVRGFKSGELAEIRYPGAVRPWQHVLDCLSGYLYVARGLLEGTGRGEWNVGPNEAGRVTVRQVADLASSIWGLENGWVDVSDRDHLHEADYLALDTGKIRSVLGWNDYLPYPESLHWTIDWEKRVYGGAEPGELAREQIRTFLEGQMGSLRWP